MTIDNKSLLQESVSITIELFDSVTKDKEGRIVNFNIPFDTAKMIGTASKDFIAHININVANLDKEKEKQLFCNDKELCADLIIKNSKSDRYNNIGTTTIDLNKARVIHSSSISRIVDSSVNISFDNFDFSGSGELLSEYILYCKVYFKDDKDNHVIKGITTLNLI